MIEPSDEALTVLLVPFKKQRGQSSITAVACLLRECFPRIDWQLRKTASGQPYDVSGRWQLSVSHSVGYLAVSLSKPTCGIDVEVLRHSDRWLNLYEWITPPFARLREPTSIDFLRAWATKEALLKWQGLGLDGGLHRQPVPEQDRPGWQLLTIDDHRIFVRHERLRPEMSLALICEQPLPVHWLIASTFYHLIRVDCAEPPGRLEGCQGRGTPGLVRPPVGLRSTDHRGGSSAGGGCHALAQGHGQSE